MDTQDAWRSATRVVHAADRDPLVTLVFDDPAAFPGGDPALADVGEIEVRTGFAGPSRAFGDLGGILLVVHEVALGAAGSGVWAAAEALLAGAVRRVRARAAGTRTAATPVSARTRVEPPDPAAQEIRQTLTVLIPTERGPALVRQVTVGPQDLDGGRFSVERIVRDLLDGTGSSPS